MQTIKTRAWEDGGERRTISVGKLRDGSVCAKQNTEGDLTQLAFGNGMHGAECTFTRSRARIRRNTTSSSLRLD
jgi:hypothetical protein